MPTYETITYESADGVGRLTLNRPYRLNGITNRMMLELYDVIGRLPVVLDARVLVLTGAGKGSCPGADLQHHDSGARRWDFTADAATLSRHFPCDVPRHHGAWNRR